MQIQQATHRLELGGEVVLVNAENFRQEGDRLFEKYNAQPKVTAIQPREPVALPRTPIATATHQIPAAPVLRGEGHIDAEGAKRSNDTRFEMKMNGFAPKMPIYEVGSRVIELGVQNARASRSEYDALPSVPQVCGTVMQQVAREERKDIEVDRLTNVRMRETGFIGRENTGGLPMNEQAFGGLLTRTGIGGHAYLTKCPIDLRAKNVNYWLEELKFSERSAEIAALASKEKWEPKDAKFRTRLNRGEREIFAVVSGGYGAFDADKIAQALSIASPDGARGSAYYDGTRLKAEVLFHTNIAPEQFVAGEFFKAGIVVRSDDTGSGAIRISAVVWQNLCLNLIILDECVQEIKAIRHVGSVDALAKKFQDGFEQALGTIDGFLMKWNYAVHDDVVDEHDVPGNNEDWLNKPVSEILPGLFNGIIERELVPVRGQRKDIVQGLMRMHELDKSAAVVGRDYISRAAVVNAFTRYAHEVNTDPFEADAIERSAGGLLNVTRANKILPYEPIDF